MHGHLNIKYKHSEYVIRVLIALPRQQWLRESTLMLGFPYIVCLVSHFPDR
jgi:hypothetical protein